MISLIRSARKIPTKTPTISAAATAEFNRPHMILPLSVLGLVMRSGW
jgi:hypothetical protein